MKKECIDSEIKKKIRNDIILAAVILVIAAAGLLLWRLFQSEGAFVAVNINGVQTQTYSLAENREIVIKTGSNKEHRNVLVIQDGKAFVSVADCPDGICVKTRAVSYVGETIVCLPHKLVIEIIAEDAVSDFDVIL